MDVFLEKMDRVDKTDISKLQSLILKYKTLEFERIKYENPKMTQTEICKALGTSDSTMRRIRNELGTPSPYRSKNKTKTKTKTDKTKTDKTKTKTDKTKTKTDKSFYCTDCSKVKSSQNHVCSSLKSNGVNSIFKNIKSKDILGSGEHSGNLASGNFGNQPSVFEIFDKEKEDHSRSHSGSHSEESYSEGDEELDKVLNRG